MPEDAEHADLLYGVGAIAAYLRLTEPQVHHLIKTSGLPIFRLATTICARRSTLDKWLANRDAAANSKPEDDLK